MTSDERQPTPAYPPQGYYVPYPDDDEIDLLELWNTIWAGKWIIIGVTAVFAITAVIVSLMLPNIYKSEALLAPVAGEQQGMLASMAGQLGGLAGLAGIDLGKGGGVDKTTLALETLQSRAFITGFVRRHDLAVPLLATSGWNQAAGEWIIDENIYDANARQWVRDVDPPKTPDPSDGELYEAFRKILEVSQDKKSSLVRLSIKSQSPEAARQWVEMLVQDINNYMREQDVQDAEKSIQYLQGQLSKTSVAEMQNIFYQLIEQQTKTVMLAEVRKEYAFKMVDPPVVPEHKAEPNRAFICLVATFAGGLLAVVVVFIRHAFSGAGVKA